VTDLFLQDFKELSSKKLGHVLLHEQQKMFGEQGSFWNKAGETWPFLSSLAGLIINIIKPRRKKC
jgi:hypothetical protein